MTSEQLSSWMGAQHTMISRAAGNGVRKENKALAEEGVVRDISLYNAIETNNAAKAAQALKKGASVNLKDKFGRTLIIIASRDSHLKVLKLLLRKAADVNVKDAMLRTPLHHASAKGQVKALRQLLEHGADANAKDAAGRTALMNACAASDEAVAKLLLRSSHIQLHLKDEAGKTAFMLACAAGSLPTVQLMFPLGTSLEDTSNDGLTALHHAAFKGHLNVVQFIVENGRESVARFSRGVDLAARTARGETAADLARRWGHGEVVRFLISSNPSSPWKKHTPYLRGLSQVI